MMVTIFGNLIAYLVTFFLGYFSLGLLLRKGSEKVFFRGEYYIYSFLIGVVEIGWTLFLLGWIGIPLSIFPVTIVLLCLGALLLTLYIKKRGLLVFRDDIRWHFKGWRSILLSSAIVLVSIKCLFGFVDILTVPTYQDDTFANWNIRAKIFYERESLVLNTEDPEFLGSGYKQYPLTPSLYKTYLAIFSSGWTEGSVNLPSFLFFLSVLGVLFFVSYRLTENILFALLAPYIATAIPIFYIHGTNPYFDVFQSVYFLMALSFLFLYLRGKVSWIVLAGMIGILGYTKSEGLIIFTIATLFAYVLFSFIQKRLKHEWGNIGKIFSIVALINLPFILFKLLYGLGFGNGNASVTDTKLTFHTEIFYPLYMALFQYGNYSIFWFLFLIAFFLFLVQKGLRSLLKNEEVIFFIGGFTAFFMILGIYFTTFTFQYVIDQTGINRSMVQMLPVFIIQFIIILHFLRNAQ